MSAAVLIFVQLYAFKGFQFIVLFLIALITGSLHSNVFLSLSEGSLYGGSLVHFRVTQFSCVSTMYRGGVHIIKFLFAFPLLIFLLWGGSQPRT